MKQPSVAKLSHLLFAFFIIIYYYCLLLSLLLLLLLLLLLFIFVIIIFVIAQVTEQVNASFPKKFLNLKQQKLLLKNLIGLKLLLTK